MQDTCTVGGPKCVVQGTRRFYLLGGTNVRLIGLLCGTLASLAGVFCMRLQVWREYFIYGQQGELFCWNVALGRGASNSILNINA